jgi:carboxyl-terminal processing protease
MEASITKLKGLGMKDLVLDLQGNGGGLLQAAQKLADEFLTGDKLVVYSEGRARPRNDLKAGETNLFEKGRLVVLIDESSASASEIVSGAIQDWDRGLIVGRRTYGKGLVQQPIDLADGSQIRLTIARYYTPAGRFIQRPYTDGVDEYKKDLLKRYENGEYFHEDSIQLPDSLKFKTLVTGRTVFGGGGIMPDIFVPVDTSQITDSYRALIRSGALNSFSLTYVDKNRKELAKKFPTFEAFKKDFSVSDAYLKEFLEYAKKEKDDLELKDEELKTSDNVLRLRMKAVLAQNMFGIAEFYELNNLDNDELLRAIKALNSDEYQKEGLAN